MTQRPLTVDLNADIGEGYGLYDFGCDGELLEVVSSANIACGFHAGDAHTMRRTVERCLSKGVSIGAHPGLPDRLGFGRREMAASPEEVADWIVYQIGALQAFVAAAGGVLRHVKPHGALYHMASAKPEIAEAIARAIRSVDSSLLLFGPAGTFLEKAALSQGVSFVAEGFADRAYLPDGRLAPRQLAGAVIEETERAVSQAVSIVKEGRSVAIDGSWAAVRAETICLHGDAANAAERARQLKQGLEAAGIKTSFPRK
ncbi:LamB/YcsF family protein [Cohnella faecalis]|uniref:5-oxoprolinase subunit A n=1 Tax=Cohnella faecalis TaxID=2315694 RepID=A0A398CN24_9BACL|nr:5-oxoprolinase subunit PxpA [Cohnella faecalis]RIE03640.1 LamB/YcsF family protein [Cohnella faecalis]